MICNYYEIYFNLDLILNHLFEFSMLSIERKKLDKTELTKPLKDFLRNTYPQLADDYNEQFSVLDQTREDFRNSQDKSDAAKDLMYK